MAFSSTNTFPTIPVILGPTASGKTAVGIALAQKLGAEIISADSRQIFEELTIGSAKPSVEEISKIPHHFISEKVLTQNYDAGKFANDAHARIREIFSSQKRVVVVGGSTLYIEGLVNGFANLPAKNDKLREALTKELQEKGAERLYQELKEMDPDHAKTLDPTKTQRLIRSLEVIRLTGKTLTELFRKQNPSNEFSFKLFGINLPREVLYQRINQRTDVMFEQGLLKEAENLFKQYPTLPGQKSIINALATVGYTELFAYFNNEISLEQAKSLIKQHTRNYAKRQLTFFRNKMSVEWLDIDPKTDSPDKITQKILKRMQ